MFWMPSTASVMNHIGMTGPNSTPIRAVPWRWITNSTTRIAMVSGTTTWCSWGAATSSPSTADSTEMAGVIMLSP